MQDLKPDDPNTRTIRALMKEIEYLLQTSEVLHEIALLPNCNNCTVSKTCAFKPKYGEIIRYNCPLHNKGEL